MQQTGGLEYITLQVTNWTRTNTREVTARVSSEAVNLYTVSGHLILRKIWRTFPCPFCSWCSFSPYLRSVRASQWENSTVLLTRQFPQWANNVGISDNERNIQIFPTAAVGENYGLNEKQPRNFTSFIHYIWSHFMHTQGDCPVKQKQKTSTEVVCARCLLQPSSVLFLGDL